MREDIVESEEKKKSREGKRKALRVRKKAIPEEATQIEINRKTMPALIGVSEFVEECSADYKSPITSTFVSRMNNMKQTISTLEEVS